MQTHRYTVFFTLFFLACASKSVQIQDVDDVRNISSQSGKITVTVENAEEIIEKYSTEFSIPNPLIGDKVSTFGRADPGHQNTIICNAVLLDDVSTQADIIVKCLKDSLDEQSGKDSSKKYRKDYVREGMFRIRISMESGFSEKKPGFHRAEKNAAESRDPSTICRRAIFDFVSNARAPKRRGV